MAQRFFHVEALWVAFAAIAFVLAVPSGGAAQKVEEKDYCERYLKHEVPRFRVARKHRTEIKPGLVLFVSIAPSDVERDKLVALACKLGRDYANEEALYVWILDSYKAARRYSPQGEGNDRTTNLSFRASYGFFCDSGKCEHSLDWWPDPLDRSRWVHIDLGEPPERGSR